uniref:hypothetical protein n=1 Tax=Trichocoleus desertorum TaxID=1481672 RepID=UPI0025B544E8|nr:hypothetical protein [Trichocoleus desertorum]
MGRKINRSVIFIVACSAVGVILGGTASWADSSRCLQSETPTNTCLTQDPAVKTVEGMSSGLLAGAGAALGATFHLNRKD